MLGEMSENNADVKSAEEIRLTDDIKEDGECPEALVEECANKYLIYGVNDTPPIHVTLVCALQVNSLFALHLSYFRFFFSFKIQKCENTKR
jgi:hypothetical protein